MNYAKNMMPIEQNSLPQKAIGFSEFRMKKWKRSSKKRLKLSEMQFLNNLYGLGIFSSHVMPFWRR